ncbi:hypothetical protein ThrDRAFT_04325 [Frankia casuarinae]|nr:hypothetical protein ThrDRAFT_04325 [Frankia casuarinae]
MVKIFVSGLAGPREMPREILAADIYSVVPANRHGLPVRNLVAGDREAADLRQEIYGISGPLVVNTAIRPLLASEERMVARLGGAPSALFRDSVRGTEAQTCRT